MPFSPTRLRLGAATAALCLFAAACGDDAAATTIDGAWARTSPMNADAGAVYFTVSSDDAISITGVSVDGSVAGRAELHETVMADMDEMAEDEMTDDEMAEDEMDSMEDDEMAHDDMAEHGSGAMMMQEVASIDVEAGGEVALAPGGLHVMLLDLPDPLEPGETFDVTLETADGESLTVEVEVMDEAPGS